VASLSVERDEINDSKKILKLLLSNKNCILKYGDDHENISDILK